jgi:hypothetical protein
MANSQNYRFKCRNPKCGYEGLRRFNIEEFDQLQYGGTQPGIACFQCGYPKMAVMKSGWHVKDGFKPGFQRNIMKYCNTYEEYKQHIKDMGLIEIGYEEIPEPEDESKRVTYWDDELLKKIYDRGIKIDGNEAEYLKAGYNID